MSADGKKIAAGVYEGFIYLSSDGGLTWTQQSNTGGGYWVSAAISADGSIMGVCNNSDFIYTAIW